MDYSFDDGARNLALDEVLLREADELGEILRFWESPEPFVVLGLTQKIRDEVELERCAELNVPVMRRCSAGGCVVQGPGCINFTRAAAPGRQDARIFTCAATPVDQDAYIFTCCCAWAP